MAGDEIQVPVHDRRSLRQAFDRVRALSRSLAAPLEDGDYRIQSMPDVSPPWWNLGHTSWFFARNALPEHERERAVGAFAGFDYALNSYYEGLGPRLPRDRRGQVAQPATAAVLRYRQAVDDAVRHWIDTCPEAGWAAFATVVAIGLQHEQQHQELLLTEILHIRASAPAELRQAYCRAGTGAAAGGAHGASGANGASGAVRRPGALAVAGGVVEIGHRDGGFAWDNELPVHRAFVEDGAFGDRLVTNAEWLAFVEDGGYRDPLLWLSNGWAAVQQHGFAAPLYWERDGARWRRFTLRGLVDLDPEAPVCHVSFYEAEAFARWFGEQVADWRGARLPTEREWEHGARTLGFDAATGNLLDDDVGGSALDVRPARAGERQFAGDVWEWTTSHYEPYPGYRPFAGALMEYNGKFMDNQRVLRGGSWATPRDHARVAYRNFWPGATRFQATGLRLFRQG